MKMLRPRSMPANTTPSPDFAVLKLDAKLDSGLVKHTPELNEKAADPDPETT